MTPTLLLATLWRLPYQHDSLALLPALPCYAGQFVGDSDNDFVAGRPELELMRPVSESPGIVLNSQQHRACA